MNRIKKLRKEKKITQIRLSIELEVSQETISAYEKGKYYPSAAMLIKLRDIFGVSIDYILGLSDTRFDPLSETNLTEDETYILNLCRKMDDSDRKRTISYIEGFCDALQKQKKTEIPKLVFPFFSLEVLRQNIH